MAKRRRLQQTLPTGDDHESDEHDESDPEDVEAR